MDDAAEQQIPPKKGGPGFAIALLATGAVAGAAGAAVPLLVMKPQSPPAASTLSPAARQFEPLTPERTAYIPFGDITVNLNEGRLNRYLHLKISLQVDKLQQEKVAKALEQKGLILRNWLLSHASDKDQEEIRGAAGQNMLRREIRDQFNEILFDDGYDRVYDVLFEEFNVQ